MLILLILVLFWLLVALFSRLSLLRIQAYWHGKRTVITEYNTPHNLTPAELGYIFDRKFGSNELLATMMHMYQRGILSLSKHPGNITGELLITKAGGKKRHVLDDCEAVVLSSVTYSEGGERKWSDISSIFSRETGARWQYERAVIGQLIDKGYLTDKAKNEPFIDRVLKSAISFAFTWAAFFTSWGAALSGTRSLGDGFAELDTFLVFIVVIPIFLIVWLMAYTYLSILSREIHLSAGIPRFATEKLRHEWRDVVGFRDYLRVVEWHRLKTQPDLKNKALPYCLACGFRVNILKGLSEVV